jgi:integration host factor subunit beta
VTKSELIEVVAAKQPHLQVKDVDLAIRSIVDHLTDTLAKGERIEIRGFGSFSLRPRQPRIGRNPKTGESVAVTESYATHFKPGNELRDRVDASKQSYRIVD